MGTRPRRQIFAVCGVLLGACGDDEPATSDDTTGASTGTSTVDTGSESGNTPESSGADDTTSTGEAESSETGFEPPVPECGNGFVEGDEECDDANDVDDDACSSACLLPCGVDWTAAHLGPTQESDIYGVSVAVDGAGNTAAIGFLREVTVDKEGNQTIGEVSTIVVALDPDGTERWAVVRDQVGLAVAPGAIAMDPNGDVYVAVASERMAGGRDVELVRLAAADGSDVWTHEIAAPVVDGVDVPDAVAIAPDGDPVLVATVRVADMDDDVWIRKVAAADGSEVWTTSYDGMAVGEFSTDNGGPLAIGPTGELFVLAQPYVDFTTSPVTLLAYPADGGEPLWTWTPVHDGAVQEFFPLGVALGDGGSIWVGYQRLTSQVEFWLAELAADGTLVATFDRDHFIGEMGDEWRMGGLAYAAERGPIVFGNYRAGFGDDDWQEAWIAQLDPRAGLRCATTLQVEGGGLVPPAVYVNGGAAMPDGGPLLVGELVDDPESALWVGRFRPQ